MLYAFHYGMYIVRFHHLLKFDSLLQISNLTSLVDFIFSRNDTLTHSYQYQPKLLLVK